MRSRLACVLLGLACFSSGYAQQNIDTPAETEDLQRRVLQLEVEVAELKQVVRQLQRSIPAAPIDSAFPGSPAQETADLTPLAPASLTAPRTDPVPGGDEEGARSSVETASRPPSPVRQQAAAPGQQQAASAVASGLSAEDRSTLDFLRETTVNLYLDTYYDYNFNAPVGRVNLLRAYDVLSNNFSLNQAAVVFDHEPDPDRGRRWGGRLDLQFGQATDTLQGNPNNEPRPDIYRNVFQAYGTYVAPVGNGLTLDFGKWASSLGIEGNYTKDQMNYSRSYWFDFLPFYHMGLRATYPINDRLSLNYWVVNGTNQAEATNGFKDELFGFTAKPHKTVSWTVNYYYGQDHPDRIEVPPTSPIPVQPGLSFEPIIPAPNGRTHIFDTYATWLATPKLTFALEGDYEIERLWRNSAPGESSAPNHVDGGAGYIQYHFTPKIALATRAEYLSDRGGLYSGLTQALKETTVTFSYKLFDGFLMDYEWRRDFSNQPSFLTSTPGVLSKQQNTVTLGLIWWWGRKEGAW
jgi:Putative beta-barrel porin-2, OmpL-like. bbp2